MSEDQQPQETPRADITPEMRRAMDRRALIRDELGRAGVQAIKNLPGLGGFLGFALKETPSQRDERLMKNLWQLLVGREPKPDEAKAGTELFHNARTPDDKGDAMVDILWALCQTGEFAELDRPDSILVRGLYRIALDREPREEERAAALAILSETPEPAARGAALEGLLTGLLRSGESVFRRPLR
jgi:hypothetical protein